MKLTFEQRQKIEPLIEQIQDDPDGVAERLIGLESALWDIFDYASKEYAEGEKGYQFAIVALEALKTESNDSPLPELCGRCGDHHNIGNPCPPIR